MAEKNDRNKSQLYQDVIRPSEQQLLIYHDEYLDAFKPKDRRDVRGDPTLTMAGFELPKASEKIKPEKK